MCNCCDAVSTRGTEIVWGLLTIAFREPWPYTAMIAFSIPLGYLVRPSAQTLGELVLSRACRVGRLLVFL